MDEKEIQDSIDRIEKNFNEYDTLNKAHEERVEELSGLMLKEVEPWLDIAKEAFAKHFKIVEVEKRVSSEYLSDTYFMIRIAWPEDKLPKDVYAMWDLAWGEMAKVIPHPITSFIFMDYE